VKTGPERTGMYRQGREQMEEECAQWGTCRHIKYSTGIGQ